MLAIRCGARKVYAVDVETVVVRTRKVISSNGLSDVVTVIGGDLLSMRTLPCVVVDVIIFDWRGRSVLDEHLLKCLYHAREMFLRGDGCGMIFPDILEVSLCGIESTALHKEKVSGTL